MLYDDLVEKFKSWIRLIIVSRSKMSLISDYEFSSDFFLKCSPYSVITTPRIICWVNNGNISGIIFYSFPFVFVLQYRISSFEKSCYEDCPSYFDIDMFEDREYEWYSSWVTYQNCLWIKGVIWEYFREKDNNILMVKLRIVGYIHRVSFLS